MNYGLPQAGEVLSASLAHSRADSMWLPGEAQSSIPVDLQGKETVAFPGNREGLLISTAWVTLMSVSLLPLLGSVGTMVSGTAVPSMHESHTCTLPLPWRHLSAKNTAMRRHLD